MVVFLCGLNIDWHYNKGYVDISIPDYIRDALTRLNHEFPARNQFIPHEHTPVIFGTKGTRKYAKSPDDSVKLDTKGIHLFQSIAGTFVILHNGY